MATVIHKPAQTAGSTLDSWSQTRLELVKQRYRWVRIATVTDRVLGLTTGLNAEVLAGNWWGMQEVPASARHGQRPRLGERAAGYGVSGRIAALPEYQPLATTGVWRITLAGESVGRLVRRDEQTYSSGAAGWQLLHIDDITEREFDLYESLLLQAE